MLTIPIEKSKEELGANMGWLSGLSSGTGSLLGGLGGAVVSGMFASKQAKKQMDYQSKMSNTAIQRQYADMRKAGINPILAARTGGASTPQGAKATVDPVTSGLGVTRLRQDLKNMQASENLTNQTAELTKEKIPGAKAEAEFWQDAGQGGKIAQFLKMMLK